jgi:predicted RNase H-like nuclease
VAYRGWMSSRVLGVDACRMGWVGVVLHEGVATVHVAKTIAALVGDVEIHGHLAVIGIDIPIGLPDSGRRQADMLAYKLVGPRRSSVFMTPVRAAMAADSHAAAVQVNKERAGEGVSVQAYRQREKIFEVDAWVRQARRRVVEVHPEVSFAELAGSPLPAGKRTWAGAHHRRRLLAAAGIHRADDSGEPGRNVAVDDVLDAGAAAWTATRVAAAVATPLPNPPVEYSDGWPAAIWV